ncbi:hypothetical protein DID88_000732 [Monilinia fructigena]|uniref:Uncharacterized protein n=1 Tax=Monilinia fructigena TaxID=38457 RepID=A0A395IIF8_9HELO|nr:hypothetical protein DID88_000732 [Monilinia fructigena]
MSDDEDVQVEKSKEADVAAQINRTKRPAENKVDTPKATEKDGAQKLAPEPASKDWGSDDDDDEDSDSDGGSDNDDDDSLLLMNWYSRRTIVQLPRQLLIHLVQD